MLIPLDTDFQQSEPVPDVLKNRYVYLWYMESILLILVAVGEIVGGDAFGALFMAMLAFAVMYMVRDNCRQMSMYCLFVFGLLVGFQGLFESIALLSVAGAGRTTESENIKSGNETSVTYETKITTHPFFDKKQGAEYNTQSAMMIASPIIMAFCCILCYISYNAYSNSLFGEEDVEAAPIQGRGYNSGQRRGYGAEAEPPARRSTNCPPRLFEGQGQRLGG